MTWPSITNMLPAWGWALMGAVPVAIVLLYFLKLKRQPLEVPSTYLWHKSIEDLHVNSIWQRLRQSLLLFLQLLIILLAILALLRPSWSGEKVVDERSIFIIDNSASMSAKDGNADGSLTRLEEAKRQVLELIDQMESDDVAMVISVSNAPTTDQPFTDDRNALRRAVERIKPTHKQTDLLQALRVASGIANPSRAGTDPGRDVMVAEPLPADLYLFTDGNFEHPSFPFGNLKPKYIKIGSEQPKNVAISAFSAERIEDKPGQVAVFGLIENYGVDDLELRVDLYLDDVDQNVNVTVQVPGRDKDTGEAGSNGVDFTLAGVESGVLKMHVAGNDLLDVDDTAWYTVNAPRKANVLLVTPGNEFLEYAFQTERAQKLAKVFVPENGVEYLTSDEYRYEAQTGAYDLVIFDRCIPAAAEDDDKTPTPMPACNTWFIGAVPKLDTWGWEPGKPWPKKELIVPRLLDTARAHPLMQLVELGDVAIAAGIPLKTPPGGTTLMDMVGSLEVKPATKDEEGEYRSVQAAMLSLGPREGHEDCMMSFAIVDKDGANTNWMRRRSFPVFVYNVLKYLGGGQSVSDTGTLRPGEPLELKVDTDRAKLEVHTPDGNKDEIAKSKETTFRFSNTDRLGPYVIRTPGADGEVVGRFAVNLFDSRESDLKPAEKIDFEWEKVEAETNFQPERKEYWKWLLLLALLVLLFEWYVYNRRVYL